MASVGQPELPLVGFQTLVLILAVALGLILFGYPGLGQKLFGPGPAETKQLKPSKKGLKKSRKEEQEDTEDTQEVGEKRWLCRLRVSEEEVRRIFNFPQRLINGRASPEWLRFRRHRLTASRFSQALTAVSEDAGVLQGDVDMTRRQLIETMILQPEAHTSPYRYGVVNESRARESYIVMRMQGMGEEERSRFRVEELGLCIWKEEPWLAASPDGVVWEGDSVGALEIKCCQNRSRMFSVDSISPQFYHQMQGEMVVLSSALGRQVSWCDFFVWCPDHHLCRRVDFDSTYFYQDVLPKLRCFYFGCYVPVARRMPVGASGNQLERSVRKLTKEERQKWKKTSRVKG